MKKFNYILTFLIVVGIVFIYSCDTNNKGLLSPTSNNNITDKILVDPCFDEYTGNCQGNRQCVHIVKNNVERWTCYGTLRIEGTTCDDEPFLCVLPLSETMICPSGDLEAGPLVPYGEYVYSVCCDLGAGELNVTVPDDPVYINLNMNCDWQIEREND